MRLIDNIETLTDTIKTFSTSVYYELNILITAPTGKYLEKEYFNVDIADHVISDIFTNSNSYYIKEFEKFLSYVCKNFKRIPDVPCLYDHYSLNKIKLDRMAFILPEKISKHIFKNFDNFTLSAFPMYGLIPDFKYFYENPICKSTKEILFSKLVENYGLKYIDVNKNILSHLKDDDKKLFIKTILSFGYNNVFRGNLNFLTEDFHRDLLKLFSSDKRELYWCLHRITQQISSINHSFSNMCDFVFEPLFFRLAESAGFDFKFPNTKDNILTGTYSKYIGKLVKNGMTIDECFKWFSNNNIVYFISKPSFSDDDIKKYLKDVVIDKKIQKSLIKNRPSIYCDILSGIIKEKLKNALTELPQETKEFIDSGIITVNTDIVFDKDSLKLLFALKDI